jgi:hypothetical protein
MNAIIGEQRGVDRIIVGCHHGKRFVRCLNCEYIPCPHFQDHVIEKRRCCDCGRILNMVLFLSNNKLVCADCKNTSHRTGRDAYIKRESFLAGAHARLAWAKRTLYHHREKGHVINISAPELLHLATETSKCRLCGINLDYSQFTGHKSNRASLDRINNDTSYDITKVQIICIMCNVGKGKYQQSEYINRCCRVADISRGINETDNGST